MSFTVVLVGRPNVGKSTLFNRLAGKKLALVDDTPGVTRDWRSAPARLGGLDFTVIDTAGLEEAFDDSLEARMRRQTEQAIGRANVVLMIVDARTGITSLDRHFAQWLRRQNVPTIVVANKAEGRAGDTAVAEAYELGLGDPLPVSAEHGEGLSLLVEALLPFAPKEEEEDKDAFFSVPEKMSETDHDEEKDDPSKPLQLAIVGRPNVGKSTLMNSLLGQERVLTGPEAGMTRDAIAESWVWKGRPFKLVDTAGLRRRARVDAKLEKLAVADTLRVIRLAQVVVLVVDGMAILDNQDLAIARLTLEEGRALVIAINKWDTVEDKNQALKRLRDRLESSLPQARGVPTVTLSALRGQKLDTLMKAVVDIYEIWKTRISTSQLNRWLRGTVDSHPPPLAEGRRIKIRYMTQIKSRPPTFAVFVSKPVDLPESYARYLISGLRDTFNLPGVPIRLLMRKGENPYAEE